MSKIKQKMKWPMSSERLSPTEKLIYLLLEGEWKLNRRKPFSITTAEIADTLAISEKAVKNVIRKMKDFNVISTIQVNRGSIHSYSLYTLETYLSNDSDNVPNYLEDGSILLDRKEVDYLFGTSLDIDDEDISY